MTDWKELKLDGVPSIRKLSAEFEIEEILLTPYRKFKVRIYENQDGSYVGYTNLLLKDFDGTPYPGVGYGHNVADALRDTVRYFLTQVGTRPERSETDFEVADPFDF